MSLSSRLDALRDKPEHELRRLTFVLAAGITGVVAVTWLSSSLAYGTFAIKGGSFADAAQDGRSADVVSPTAPSPVAAAAAVLGITQKPAQIKIVDTDSGKIGEVQIAPSEPTVIPF